MTSKVRTLLLGLLLISLLAGCSSASTYMDDMSLETEQEFSLEEYQAKRMELEQRLAEYEQKVREIYELYY